MLKAFGLTSIIVAGAFLSLPMTASAATPAPSITVAGLTIANVEVVRMHRRMRHMRRSNPSAQGWKKNF